MTCVYWENNFTPGARRQPPSDHETPYYEQTMLSAKVIGTTTSSVKHPSMEGQKLLVVLPTLADGKTPDGTPLVAVDQQGAGIGDTVVITSDGRYSRELLGRDNTPVRWTVVGIQDTTESKSFPIHN